MLIGCGEKDLWNPHDGVQNGGKEAAKVGKGVDEGAVLPVGENDGAGVGGECGGDGEEGIEDVRRIEV